MSAVRKSPSSGPQSPDVWGFYEPDTGSIQYVAADPNNAKAAIIDPVLNFDPASASTSTKAADAILAHVEREKLEVQWILDTHPHADHFTAGAYLAGKLGAPHAIGSKAEAVAAIWRDLYHEPSGFDVHRDFDRLLDDGETLGIGDLQVTAMLSPGHTLASVTYRIGSDAAFVHDTLMQPDSGTARADFPGGSAKVLYDSIQAIFALPEQTRLFVGHDYCADGREPEWEATVGQQKRDNIHVGNGEDEETFVRLRTERDKTLNIPDRMLFALQVNLRGGRLPEAEDDGSVIFRIPANRF